MKRHCSFLALFFVLLWSVTSNALVQVEVLESTSFTRSTGEPVTETVTFPGVAGQATVKLWNGSLQDDSVERVSSSTVTVNGQEVFGPSNFNQNGDSLEAEAALIDGQNRVDVCLKGKPGGQVTIQIIQNLPNARPEIISIPITYASENQVYSYDFYAVDQDGDTLSYSLNSSPEGMIIDPYTGVISWIPNSSQLGEYSIDVCVTDGKETITQSFVVEVKPNIQAYSQFVTAESGSMVEISDPSSEIFGTRVIIPPDALPADCTITITKILYPSYAPPGCLAVDLRPNLLFNTPVTIEIPFTGQFVSTYGINEENPPTLYNFNPSDQVWEEVEDVTIDLMNRKVIANVSHFSEYMVSGEGGGLPYQKRRLIKVKGCSSSSEESNVIIIHGIRDGYGNYVGPDGELFTADDGELLRYALSHYDNVYFYNYPWNRHIETNAKELAKLIPQDQRFDIIAHSMGGLVARYLVETGVSDELCPLGNIDRLVTLGTPHFGTTFDTLAQLVVPVLPLDIHLYFQLYFPGLLDAVSGSAFLNQLNKHAGLGTQTATLFAIAGDKGDGSDGVVSIRSAWGFADLENVDKISDESPLFGCHTHLNSEMITRGIGRLIQNWFGIQPIPPEIKETAPTGIVNTNRPTISFTVESPTCNKLDTGLLMHFELDGESIDYVILQDGTLYCQKGTYQIQETDRQAKISFTPNYDLTVGEHTVEIFATDSAARSFEIEGYWAKESWTFQVVLLPIIYIEKMPSAWDPFFKCLISPPEAEIANWDWSQFHTNIILDGSPITHNNDFDNNNLVAYFSLNSISEGQHEIIVEVLDFDNNVVIREVKSFEISSLNHVIVTDPLYLEDIVVFNLVCPSTGSYTIDLSAEYDAGIYIDTNYSDEDVIDLVGNTIIPKKAGNAVVSVMYTTMNPFYPDCPCGEEDCIEFCFCDEFPVPHECFGDLITIYDRIDVYVKDRPRYSVEGNWVYDVRSGDLTLAGESCDGDQIRTTNSWVYDKIWWKNGHANIGAEWFWYYYDGEFCTKDYDPFGPPSIGTITAEVCRASGYLDTWNSDFETVNIELNGSGSITRYCWEEEDEYGNMEISCISSGRLEGRFYGNITLWYDPDGDGVSAAFDNCGSTYNPNQADSDGDRVGDECDSTPNGL